MCIDERLVTIQLVCINISNREPPVDCTMSDLDEHRYDAFQDANSMLFVSKDVARTLLAFVYCNQKKFDKALPLLEEVIKRGDYHLEYSQATEYNNNAECILGYHIQTRSGEACHPCLDYKDDTNSC